MIHTIQNNFLTVQVKNAGAELCSIKDKAGTEYLFVANPPTGAARPRSVPFCGSLKTNLSSMRENHIRWGSMVLPGTGTFLCCKKKKLPFGFGSHRTRKRLSYIPSPSCWISVISWKAIPSVCYGRCTILQIKAFSSLSAHIQRSSVLPAAAEWTAAIWDLICPATFPIACLTIRGW